MNKDIRLAVSFKGHRKRKRLKRILGPGADGLLIDLWITVAMDCPSGVLNGWDKDDIADACDWEEDAEKLVNALLKSKWLDKNGNGDYVVHDWCEHQGWACNAETRSEIASKNILLRWSLKNLKNEDREPFKKWFNDHYKYNKGDSTEDVLGFYWEYTSGNTDLCDSYTNRNTDSIKYESNTDGNTDSYQPYTDGNTDSKKKDTIRIPSVIPLVPIRNTPSPSPSPLPSPSPSPTYKKTPEPDPENQGPPLPPDTNPPSGVSSKKKNSYPVFDKGGNGNHRKYFQDINMACEQIGRLPPKRKKFSPQKWAQSSINARAHPGAVAETLVGLEVFWDSAKDPWGVCDKILRTKNGNWNEQDAIAIHEKLKAMKPDKLSGFTHGLFQEMP